MLPKVELPWVMVTPGVLVVTTARTLVAVPMPLLLSVTFILTLSPGSTLPSPLPRPPSAQVSSGAQPCANRFGAPTQRLQGVGTVIVHELVVLT